MSEVKSEAPKNAPQQIRETPEEEPVVQGEVVKAINGSVNGEINETLMVAVDAVAMKHVEILKKTEGLSEADSDFAQRFQDTLMEKEGPVMKEEDRRHMIELDSHVDTKSTEEANEWINNFSSDSIFANQRKKLGITGKSDEKPFIIKVLDLNHREWQEKTHSPSMFAYTHSEGSNDPSVIYLSSMHYDSIKSGKYVLDTQQLEHEYRHTQRSFSSANGRLFRFLDEIATNVTGYAPIRLLLRYLCASTDDLTDKQAWEAYEHDDDDEKAKFLEGWAKNFSSKGLLIMGAKKSSEHSEDKDGIDNLPYCEQKNLSANPELAFAETLLALREQVDSDWVEKLRENLKTHPGVSRKIIDITLGHHFNKYKKDIDNIEAPRFKLLLQALEDEAKRRKDEGEAGFYKE